MQFLNDDNQPPLIFNRRLRTARGIDELIGLSRGLIADGHLCGFEIEYLVNWIMANPEACEVFPGSVLLSRLERIMSDKVVTPEEAEHLAQTLKELTGGTLQPGENIASTLPIDDPPPAIEFDGMTFCLTGSFIYGPRKACEQIILELGGECKSSVSAKVEYVVIGTIGSRDWKHSTHGNKIQRAVELRDSGHPLAIVTEEHWTAAL